MTELYKVTEKGRGNPRIVFILGGWTTRPWLYSLTMRALERNGYHAILYTYTNSVFSTDIVATAAHMHALRDAALDRLSEIRAQGPEEISVFGHSLGTIVGLMVANVSADVSRVVLNLTGTSPADAVWEWDIVKPFFKRDLENRSLTLDSLREAWAAIAPINNIDNLQGKKLLVYLAKRDKLIPYDHGLELVRRLDQHGYDHKLVTNSQGHMISGVYNMIRSKTYLDFLRRN